MFGFDPANVLRIAINVALNESIKILNSVFQIGHVFIRTENILKWDTARSQTSYFGRLLEHRE